MTYYDLYLEGGHIVPIQDPRDDIAELWRAYISVDHIFINAISGPAIIRSDKLVAIIRVTVS
jgi:hypothetical protein